MPKAPVLDKVAVDLARGHTQPAIQRLSSLVSAYPHDLDLRHRLAAVHRMTGNAVEAGRWDYLNPTAEPAETGAFERAFPSAPRRLAALRWQGSADLAPTEHARQRLLDLTEAARQDTPPVEVEPRWWRITTVLLTGTAAVVVAALVVLGAVTVLQAF
ncbi:MAG: hypothetical protein HOU81_16870 [Hamadaea sp.]|uniref:DUF6584 family protein n=1 Tax=Hamadaea sp. TaxID=2024425 RepID=UPI00181AA576|nr:DUF6584 family protein [Hamadaea sp.]NUR72490.1 hypothetical protein [Hamadaea sp.]NUT17767.1 hypothetical protein [Hamadaea sp.]